MKIHHGIWFSFSSVHRHVSLLSLSGVFLKATQGGWFMSAPAELQSSVYSASKLIECNYTLSPKEPCHLPVTDIQINGDALAGYTQCRCRSGYMRHLLSYWPSLWVTAEIWSVMWQNKSVSQRLLARSRGGVHYNWFYRCPSILHMCVCLCVRLQEWWPPTGTVELKKVQTAQREMPECGCVYTNSCYVCAARCMFYCFLCSADSIDNRYCLPVRLGCVFRDRKRDLKQQRWAA